MFFLKVKINEFMAFLPIYNCFHPIMKKSTEDIQEIDGDLQKLVDDMFETMYSADGIGLAANQVGISKSLVVIDSSAATKKNDPKYVLINPQILESSDETNEYQEGCLSVPKFFEDVIRPKKVKVRYWDLKGKEFNIEVDDTLARVMQHEIDHLNGILFYERLTPIRRTLSKSKLNRIRKRQTKPDYEMVYE